MHLISKKGVENLLIFFLMQILSHMHTELQAAILCGNTSILLEILLTESNYTFLFSRKRKKPHSLVQSSVIQEIERYNEDSER